jgi:hypothetical protein
MAGWGKRLHIIRSIVAVLFTYARLPKTRTISIVHIALAASIWRACPIQGWLTYVAGQDRGSVQKRCDYRLNRLRVYP